MMVFCVHLVIGQPLTGASGVARPSRTKSHPAALGHFLQPAARRAAVLLAFGQTMTSGEEKRGKDDRKQNMLAPMALFISI